MSKKPKKKKIEVVTEEPEGWESLAEEGSEDGTLGMNPELEEALREAAAAVSEPEASTGAENSEGAAPDAAGDDVAEEAEGGTTPASATDMSLALLRVDLAEAVDRRLRTEAELQNFRKRALRERKEALQYGSQNLVKDLLSVVDNLDRAIDHARQSEGGDLQSLLQGVELVQRELLVVLENHHVKEIEAVEKVFNPALHEAMAQVENESVEPNTVVDVLQKGYQLHDRLVRPSRVVVAKATGEKDEANDNDEEEVGD